MKRRNVSPEAITGKETSGDLLREKFPAYVGRNVREAFRLMKQAIEEDYFIFLTLSGAMTPAGMHHSCLQPLIENGFINCITTTGANIYHDVHRSIGFEVEEINPHHSDLDYRNEETVRIYDLGLTHEMLCETDKFLGRVLKTPAFQKSMTTPEFHSELGRAVAEHEEKSGISKPSLVSTCHRHGVPIFCGAPQDSSWFLEALQLSMLHEDFLFEVDVRRDVLQMAALQWLTQHQGKTAVWILGGGVPKNYTLQGEPTLSQVFGMDARGFDLDVQICVDVADNGALSPCNAGEGHTWGKTSADCVTTRSVYLRSDVTVILPILTHALMSELSPRPAKRLVDKLPEAEDFIKKEFKKIFSDPNKAIYSGY